MKAYVFPGQGAQFPGMGKELYDSVPAAKALMEEANDILGFRLTDIMFAGSDEDLKVTEVTQPAIFVHSAVAALCGGLPAPDMAAGHSLGEFSALAAAGAISFPDALKLVSIRAREMQKCCEAHPGAMAAVIGLTDEAVIAVCESVSAEDNGICIAANFNSDGQVVISGNAEAVQKAGALLAEAGARRVLPLKVSGAFHSPLMEPARAELAKAIDATVIAKPSCPVYQNVTARPETDPAKIKVNLLKQLTSPVLWTATIRRMRADGADEFTEIGPGNTLAGLIRRIQ